MVLPGWNVSEPLQLALKLYEVAEALKKAPEDAKAFIAKVDRFSRSIQRLQQILENEVDSRSPPPNQNHLRESLKECQDCVRRCEDFSKPFRSLTRDDNGAWAGAGQRVRVVWHDKKTEKLAVEMDSLVSIMSLDLNIGNYQHIRSRQESLTTPPDISFPGPSRIGTTSSLPSYATSPPSLRGYEADTDQRARTPSDWLGLRNIPQEELKRTSLESERFRFLLGGEDGSSRAFQSPASSPSARRQSKALPDLPELDGDLLEPLDSRPGTGAEVAVGSPESPKVSSSPANSFQNACRAVTGPSPPLTIGSRRSSITAAATLGSRSSITTVPDSFVLEAVVDNIRDAELSYVRKDKRMHCPIVRIESWRDVPTRRRCIVLRRPLGSSTEFCFLSEHERIIPRIEHPEAYGSGSKLKVKIQDMPLFSRNLSSSRRASDASIMTSAPSVTTSSATSIRSFSSVGSPSMSGLEEKSKVARRHEYSFEHERDYYAFQGLLMGAGIHLQLQLPVQLISLKCYGDSKSTKLSILQYLGLWQLGCHQFMMFFCNMTSEKHKEYKSRYTRVAPETER
ncbi:hypothetical protein ACLMJK_007062 [Lecanora helva]